MPMPSDSGVETLSKKEARLQVRTAAASLPAATDALPGTGTCTLNPASLQTSRLTNPPTRCCLQAYAKFKEKRQKLRLTGGNKIRCECTTSAAQRAPCA